jgi:hypothetical protein
MSRLSLVTFVTVLGALAATPIAASQASSPVVPAPAAFEFMQVRQPPSAPTTVPASGQTTPPAAAANSPATSAIDGHVMPTQNVHIDVTITDTLGAAPTKKTVSMLVADKRTGQIRSSLSILVPSGVGGNGTYRSIGINVDATPEVRADGHVFMRLSLEYTPDNPAVESGTPQKPASLNESMAVVVADGKPTMLSQSADPQSDRKVTLEVTATVVR